jgi:pyridoxamine 5'-phosphate oxidase family protein
MEPFTAAETEYLTTQPLGRIATTSADATPDLAPVTFELDDEGRILVTGMDPKRTLKWRNVVATGKAAFAVDDLASRDPWTPRGVKVVGPADTYDDEQGRSWIRITPETIWSWGINVGADTHFGPIEKRSAR